MYLADNHKCWRTTKYCDMVVQRTTWYFFLFLTLVTGQQILIPSFLRYFLITLKCSIVTGRISGYRVLKNLSMLKTILLFLIFFAKISKTISQTNSFLFLYCSCDIIKSWTFFSICAWFIKYVREKSLFCRQTCVSFRVCHRDFAIKAVLWYEILKTASYVGDGRRNIASHKLNSAQKLACVIMIKGLRRRDKVYCQNSGD